MGSSNTGQTDISFTHNGPGRIVELERRKVTAFAAISATNETLPYTKIIHIEGEAAPTILSINESATLAEMTEGDDLEVPSQ